MIQSAICNSFINELPQGLHDFRSTGDTFKMALYTDSATLNMNTTVYTVTGEVSGTNYTAGGIDLTSNDPVFSSLTSLLDFQDVTFTNVTLSNIQGALIYNSTQGNRSVIVLRFNAVINATAQDLNMLFPGVTATSAILRITKNG